MSTTFLVLLVLLAVLPHFYIVPKFNMSKNDEEKDLLASISFIISLIFIVVGILYILGHLFIIGLSWSLLVPVLVAGVLFCLSLSMALEVDPGFLDKLKD